MSLRPSQPGVARLNQRRQRMAPGGRRWSESPVPRIGRRRPRQAGLGYVAAIKTDSAGSGATECMFLNGVDLAAGDLVVTWVALAGYTATAATGWTTVTSGTVNGRLSYLVAYRVADQGMVTGGFAGHPLSGAGDSYHAIAAFVRGAGGARAALTGSVVTATAATSIAYRSAAGALPWQFVGYRPNPSPVTLTMSDSPSSNPDSEYVAQVMLGGQTYLAVRGTTPWQSSDGDLGVHPTSASAASTASGDWFSMGLGLV